jgi:hypothetical protein
MKGFPKKLKTKKDYENIVNDFGYTQKVKEAYQALLETDKHYVFDKELATEDERTGPEPEYKVMKEDDQETKTVRIVQYKLVDNLDSKLKELGFTESEVQEVIDLC